MHKVSAMEQSRYRKFACFCFKNFIFLKIYIFITYNIICDLEAQICYFDDSKPWFRPPEGLACKRFFISTSSIQTFQIKINLK